MNLTIILLPIIKSDCNYGPNENGKDKGGTMKINSEGLLLRIHVGNSETFEGQPLYEAIVHKARQSNLAGATIIKGSLGFGSTSQRDKSHPDSLAPDQPVIVEVVDVEEKINLFAKKLDGMIQGGLVTRSPVHLTKYAEQKAS